MSSMIGADAFLFDIDGTLLVTRDLVHWNALHQAMLEVYGIDTTIEGLSYHGKTDVAILRAALNRCGVSDVTFYKALPATLAVVCREVSTHAQGISPEVCASIPELLAEITDREKLLGVASGNLEIVGWHKISAARLRDFFAFGSFGDHCELRAAIFDHAVARVKNSLGSHSRVCFIGDTPDDIRAARLVGAQVVAVSTGTFSYEALSAIHPDACCRTCSELLGRLQ